MESCLRDVIARGVEAELKAKKNEKSNRQRPTTERGRSVPRPRKRSVPQPQKTREVKHRATVTAAAEELGQLTLPQQVAAVNKVSMPPTLAPHCHGRDPCTGCTGARVVGAADRLSPGDPGSAQGSDRAWARAGASGGGDAAPTDCHHARWRRGRRQVRSAGQGQHAGRDCAACETAGGEASRRRRPGTRAGAARGEVEAG